MGFGRDSTESGVQIVRFPQNLGMSKLLILEAVSTISAVPNRDEASLGNDRFITAVTLLRQRRVISSGL
jgi:hypothetical protein